MTSNRHPGFVWNTWLNSWAETDDAAWMAYVRFGWHGNLWPGSGPNAFGALRKAYTRCVRAEMARRLKR